MFVNKTKIVSVSFADTIGETDNVSEDLYCTAIARCAKKRQRIVVDVKKHKCKGGNYFIGSAGVDRSEIEDVYIRKEKVFSNKRDLGKFLGLAGRNPVKTKYVVFDSVVTSKTDVVLLLLSPKYVGRILGLSAYIGEFGVDVVPAVSTCASIYRPLINKNDIHVNFIDYFDRKYQCNGFFEDSEMIVSMLPDVYGRLNEIFDKSAHGTASIEDMEIFNLPEL